MRRIRFRAWRTWRRTASRFRSRTGTCASLPRLTGGPFRYGVHLDAYLEQALRIAHVPLKQAVIAPSALSLLYPQQPIDGYPRAMFLGELADEAEADIRRCLDGGARKVQLEFTEGRLSVKLDPSKGLLGQFIELNNEVLGRFGDEERTRIGVHTCPGGDQDSTHSLDAPYAELLPSLFELRAGNFYIAPERLGTTDDCGFAPFGDDTSTPREVAFAKIRARVEGTALASQQLGV